MTVIWINNPLILFNKKYIGQIWPTSKMSREEKINSITRLVITLTILGYLVTNSYKFIMIGLLTLAIIAILYKFASKKDEKKKKMKKEPFTNPNLYNSLKNEYRNPSEKNPFMNVLLPEIKYDNKRKEAAPSYNRAVEKKINENTKNWVVDEDFGGSKKLKDKLFATLGDSYDFENNAQRTFYTMPNTTIPNDQKGFAEFCYGSMVSSKEGNEFALLRNQPRLGAVTN